MVRKSRKQFTIRFLHRTTLFLVFFTFGSLLLFLVGNFQDFLDSSQFIVLEVLSAVSVLSLVVSIFTFAIELSASIGRRKGIYLSMAAVSFACAAVSLASAIVARGILIFSAGIGR